MPYLDDIDIETFEAGKYLETRIPGYSSMSEAKRQQARIELTRDDPLLFAIVYFTETLRGGGDGKITLADMHIELCRMARQFRGELDPIRPLRLAIIAPRRAGKTSWLYKIISFWLAAHGHRQFFYVVTGTGRQAQIWIKNFKLVMDRNQLIRKDFPDLCRPMKREETGRSLADDANLYLSESGFIIGAQSADGNSLGLSVDDARPDFILFDDIEPPGGSYSLYEMARRLTNVTEGALPMGAEGAIVVFVGTVLMPGSILDQLRVHAVKPNPASWISDMGLRVRHFRPFVNRLTGEETITAGPDSRSFWPGRHKTEKLVREQHTRNFAIVYANEPLPENGAYWREGDIGRGTIPDNEATITGIFLDPAVTTKKKSDFTAVAIIRFAPRLMQFEILYGRAFKPTKLSDMPSYITGLIAQYPEITLIGVEVNQGGDLWLDHYGDIPGVHYMPIHQSKTDGNKGARAAAVLRLGRKSVFMSTEPWADTGELEREMYSFPNGLHDDLPDAACFGVLKLLNMYGRNVVTESEELYV